MLISPCCSNLEANSLSPTKVLDNFEQVTRLRISQRPSIRIRLLGEWWVAFQPLKANCRINVIAQHGFTRVQISDRKLSTASRRSSCETLDPAVLLPESSL